MKPKLYRRPFRSEFNAAPDPFRKLFDRTVAIQQVDRSLISNPRDEDRERLKILVDSIVIYIRLLDSMIA